MRSTHDRQTADPLAAVRDLGVLAHVAAGKTTVTERIPYLTGATRKRGEAHDGTHRKRSVTQGRGGPRAQPRRRVRRTATASGTHATPPGGRPRKRTARGGGPG